MILTPQIKWMRKKWNWIALLEPKAKKKDNIEYISVSCFDQNLTILCLLIISYPIYPYDYWLYVLDRILKLILKDEIPACNKSNSNLYTCRVEPYVGLPCDWCRPRVIHNYVEYRGIAARIHLTLPWHKTMAGQ